MELNGVLEGLGLKPSEATTYLALLQLGPSPVLAIARRTGLKRPTVYLILDELMKHGFVARVPQEKKKLFLALPPERLKEDLERRAETLLQALPQLAALYKTQTAKPAIQLFESTEGIIQAYREITGSSAKEILSFFSIESVPPEFQIAYKLFTDAFKKRGIKGREIIYTADRNHSYIKGVKNLPGYEVRFTTAANKFFTDSIVAGNKIALFSFQKRFALVIESEDIAKSLR
ncbi:MAG: helix-turn-helix domain-containing protein, partial [Patescibacteria group bacterium]